MRVLFAVNNDNIANAIIKKYQKEYKEILSCKNVYYFNAIIKELQTNRNYDRIVISEDLEPFANNNYDTIDKFLFEKLDKISDEATKANGDTSEIIVICADRRTKSDDMLVKFFSIGIYNALLGQDRSIDELCRLINQPRTKKDAKTYYKIETNNVEYQAENENNVSEAEVQNILAHYKRLGKNEDKYIDSFNNIVSQYTDAQLKLIIPYLPMHVKAVLEERSPKYQELVTFSVTKKKDNEEYKARSLKSVKEAQKEEKIKIKMLNSESSKPKMSKPVVIPSALSGIKAKTKEEVKTVGNKDTSIKKDDIQDFEEPLAQDTPIPKKEKKTVQIPKIDMKERKVQDIEVKPIEVTPLKKDEIEVEEENQAKPEVTTEKRGRGRPRKNPIVVEEEPKPKRGRGRPKKQPEKTEEKLDDEELDLFNIPEPEEIKKEQDVEIEEFDLFGLDDDNFELDTENKKEEENEELDLFNLDDDSDNEEEVDLFKLDKDSDDEEELDLFDLDEDDEEELDLFNLDKDSDDEEELDLFNLDNDQDDENLKEEEIDLFGLDEDNIEIEKDDDKESNTEEDEEIDLFSFDENDDNDDEEELDLFGTSEEVLDEEEDNQSSNLFSANSNANKVEETIKQKELISNHKQVAVNTPVAISKDKKVVSFVGTTKNGTSFVVNNLATILSSMNVSTAILDITKSKNAYYIYTNDDEYLRETAANCMTKLEKGIADGIKVNKNLAVYTSLPGEEISYGDIGSMLNTLLENHNLVLIDCDFETPAEFFDNSQEIYLVQSMDVLTIQPLTAFLRTLKAKNVLKQEKLRIIINKEQKVKSLSAKILIGGMANYNDPSMSFMTELFDKDAVKQYFAIPFEIQNYTTYLDSLVNCRISFNGYTKQFINLITELAGVVYPLINKKRSFNPLGKNKKGETLQFSEETNDTLSKMKKNY